MILNPLMIVPRETEQLLQLKTIHSFSPLLASNSKLAGCLHALVNAVICSLHFRLLAFQAHISYSALLATESSVLSQPADFLLDYSLIIYSFF
jgi:hypothetical protein